MRRKHLSRNASQSGYCPMSCSASALLAMDGKPESTRRFRIGRRPTSQQKSGGEREGRKRPAPTEDGVQIGIVFLDSGARQLSCAALIDPIKGHQLDVMAWMLRAQVAHDCGLGAAATQVLGDGSAKVSARSPDAPFLRVVIICDERFVVSHEYSRREGLQVGRRSRAFVLLRLIKLLESLHSGLLRERHGGDRLSEMTCNVPGRAHDELN